MAATHSAFVAELLDSIPHAPESPNPQSFLSARTTARLLLDILLHPTHWHRLGSAVWESGLDLKSPIRSPNILYLQNPLHSQSLSNLLKHVEVDLIDVEILLGCVDTGDWTCLLKETSQNLDPKLQQEVVQTLENLCLLSFYLRSGLMNLVASSSIARSIPVDAKEQADDAMIQDLVARILQTDQQQTSTTSGRNKTWLQAFTDQSLRLLSLQDPQNRALPSKLSTLLNEVLEIIRLNKIRKDGWTDANASEKLSDAQFQQLGRILSTSFFTVLEFADCSLLLPIENVALLSRYAAQLPTSWYSDDFLWATIRMAQKYLFTEKQDKIRVPLQVGGLTALATLWSFWMRKTGSAEANILGQELIELMAEILAVPSLFTGPESRGLLGACFSGLATGLDKWSGLMEPKIVQGLVAGLERGRISAQDRDMDSIQASLATVLKSEILGSRQGGNNGQNSISKLVTAFLQSFYGGSSLTTPLIVSNVDELFQIQRLLQFMVTQRAGLTPVKDDEDGKKKRKKRKAKKAVSLKGSEWFHALVYGIQDVSSPDSLPTLLATAGILRAIQHAEDDPPKVDSDSLALVQDLFVSRLSSCVGFLKQDSGFAMLPNHAQACLVFATSQTVPFLPACKINPEECALLADLLVDAMLQPNEGIVPVNEILRVITYELARERNRLKIDGAAHQVLTKTIKGPLFSEMGRIARTVATLMEGMATAGDWIRIEALLQRMHSFAINMHVDWARCGLSKSDSFVEPSTGRDDKAVAIMTLDQDTTKTMAMLSQVFKTILFAYTMIFSSAVEKSSPETVPAGIIAQLDYLILDSYAYLFFVTYKLGPGGFQVYEDLITTILTRMVVSEAAVVGTISSADQQKEKEEGTVDPRRHLLLNRTLRAMKPKAELGFHDPVLESRTLFFMNLLERVMVAVEESFLERELLPMVYPYLLKNDQKDLFESAHSIVMSVFLTRKRIAQEVGPYYSNLLLQHFPDQINIDQLRAAFTTMIRSLSETEDALAWLCVERLLERIDQYDALAKADIEAAAAQLEGSAANVPGITEAAVGAAKAVKELELQREKEKALVEVATNIHQDLSPKASASQIPSLGTNTTTSPTPAEAAASLARIKERGELLLALFDQLSSVNLIFVETLGQKIRSLIAQEPSLNARRALLSCLFDVIGGPAVDHTKRDWAVKWYLGLVSEFGTARHSDGQEIKDDQKHDLGPSHL
ncbi:hypothetical protein BGZ83_004943 [Gryganskiella cystojenkinii]|nr:hypothetical protein BGZ83_004943 [Gryganskiella cystojenkinii]